MSVVSISSFANIKRDDPEPTATPTKSMPKVAVANYDDGIYDLIEFDGKRLERPDSEWKKLLTPIQFAILRQAATETARIQQALTDNHEDGTYYCAACGLSLFFVQKQSSNPAPAGRAFMSRSIKRTSLKRKTVHCLAKTGPRPYARDAIRISAMSLTTARSQQELSMYEFWTGWSFKKQ